MESNHHKQIQSLLHYHYANPQLLKMERVVRFELTTSSLENSYSTNWVTHAKNGGEGEIRTLGGFLVHNSLANCLFRPLRHLTVKSFDKLRFLQETILSVFGSIVKWSCIKMAEATGIEPVRVYGPSCFQDSFLDLPDYFHIN